MIAAFSTSSPWASVALLGESGDVMWSDRREAAHKASAACLAMLDEARGKLGFDLADLDGFAAETGPGSFTGVRVGVMLAKTFAFLYNRPVLGADGFDLVDPDGVVVLPSKRGEYFVRRPGEAAFRTPDLPIAPFRGFGPGVEPSSPPDAAAFGAILSRLPRQSAFEFCPQYLIEPSISTPKQPFRKTEAGSVGLGGPRA